MLIWKSQISCPTLVLKKVCRSQPRLHFSSSPLIKAGLTHPFHAMSWGRGPDALSLASSYCPSSVHQKYSHFNQPSDFSLLSMTKWKKNWAVCFSLLLELEEEETSHSSPPCSPTFPLIFSPSLPPVTFFLLCLVLLSKKKRLIWVWWHSQHAMCALFFFSRGRSKREVSILICAVIRGVLQTGRGDRSVPIQVADQLRVLLPLVIFTGFCPEFLGN